MTDESSVEETTPNGASEIGLPSEQVDEAPDSAPVYRDQRKRYPWWVKSVDEPTTAINRNKHKRIDMERLTVDLVGRFHHAKNRAEVVNRAGRVGLPQYIGVDKAAVLGKKGWTRQKRWLQENSPGSRHEDQALHNAAQSVQYNLGHASFYYNRHAGLDPASRCS